MLKVCDVRVGILPMVMWVQVSYQNEKDSLYIPLVAGGRLLRAEQQAMIPVTDSVMWCVGEVNSQFKLLSNVTPRPAPQIINIHSNT